MPDPTPYPVFAISAWADGEVTPADNKAEPTTEETES